MEFVLKNASKENILSLTRKIGYFQLPERSDGWRRTNVLRLPEKSSEMSFVRPMERGGYPRFHIYLKSEGEDLIFNLHLDQKKPIYKGITAHSGEYDGEIVEKEAERIKQIIK